MKLLVIMGSPRKGNTYRACEELCTYLRQDDAVECDYLWLKDANLLPCKGCFACFTRGEDTCPNKDDALAIEQKMRDADGVVFASPVYGMNVSGLMKHFIDRFSYLFHRPRFFDKKAFLLTTTGALGHKDVLKYMDTVATVWGFEVAGRAGLIIPPGTLSLRQARKNKDTLQKAAKDFSAALQRKQRKRPGMMDVIIFHSQRAVFSQLERELPCDYHYWNDLGWLSPGARYFVDVPVNPLYLAIGRIAGWMARRRVRKDRLQGTGDAG